jgi:FkbH-like protein
MLENIQSKIKLIIWDLDETFWSGTLSEEGIEEIPYNVEVLIKLTERGIISSICSKNDFSSAKAELEKLNVWDMFVFPHIDWTPKGIAIKNIIKRCQLRAENVLFIDDNQGNRNEALHFNEGINVASEKIVPFLLESEYLIGKNDLSRSRLSQYKLLEEKYTEATQKNLDNIDFLKQSKIEILIDRDIKKHKERIIELENRSNQLNFTKKRIKESDFDAICESYNDSAVIFVKDKYGDYGLVGFYVKYEKELLHFVFSCRILNMYIENALFKFLDRPKLVIKGDVATPGILDEHVDCSFCNIIESGGDLANVKSIKGADIALIGGCDLGAIEHYFSSENNIVSQFNFVNDNGFSVHSEHTCLFGYSIEDKSRLVDALNGVPLFDAEDIYNNILNKENKFDVVIYSPLNDYSRGLYKSKLHPDIVIPFETFNKDWSVFVEEEDLPTHLTSFTPAVRKIFSEMFTFIGPISKGSFEHNISHLVDSRKETLFIFLTGSEVEPRYVGEAEMNMLERHVELNGVLKKVEEEKSNVLLCDVNDFIVSSADLKDNIRHYNKKIYHSIALRIDEILKSKLHITLRPSKLNRFMSGVKYRFQKLKGN